MYLQRNNDIEENIRVIFTAGNVPGYENIFLLSLEAFQGGRAANDSKDFTKEGWSKIQGGP